MYANCVLWAIAIKGIRKRLDSEERDLKGVGSGIPNIEQKTLVNFTQIYQLAIATTYFHI